MLPNEIRLGVITSFIGAPYFIFLLILTPLINRIETPLKLPASISDIFSGVEYNDKKNIN